MPLTEDALEDVWEWLADGVEAAGSRDRLFLAKLALLLADGLGDKAAVRGAIAEALRNLA